MHETLPLFVLYVSATHTVHTPPFGPVYPALQVQPTIVELEMVAFALDGQVKQVDDVLEPIVSEYVLTEQSVYSTLPLIVLYLSGTHDEYGPPLAPVYPVLQV